MSDYVVELGRDPRALVTYRERCVRLSLGLQVSGLSGKTLGDALSCPKR